MPPRAIRLSTNLGGRMWIVSPVAVQPPHCVHEGCENMSGMNRQKREALVSRYLNLQGSLGLSSSCFLNNDRSVITRWHDNSIDQICFYTLARADQSITEAPRFACVPDSLCLPLALLIWKLPGRPRRLEPPHGDPGSLGRTCSAEYQDPCPDYFSRLTGHSIRPLCVLRTEIDVTCGSRTSNALVVPAGSAVAVQRTTSATTYY